MKSKKYVRKLSPLEETLELACDTIKIVNSTIKTLTQKPHPLYEYETERGKATILGYLGEDREVLVIPDKIHDYPVVSLRNVGHHFFKNCPSLIDLTLPKNLTSIKGTVFREANKLRYLRYEGDTLQDSFYSTTRELGELCYLPESHTIYGLLTNQQLFQTICNALNEFPDSLKLGDSPLATLFQEELFPLLLEEGEPAHYAWLLSDQTLFSMHKLNQLLEKSISDKNVTVTAMLLAYQEKHFSQEDLDRRELVSVGLALPTLQDLKTIWQCDETDRGIVIHGFSEGDEEQLISGTLEDDTPIFALSNKNKYPYFIDIYVGQHKIVSPYQGLKRLHLETTGKIAAHTFHGCSSLEEITLLQVREIEKSAFMDCSSLKKIELPIALSTISCEMFVNCTALETVQIPDTVIEIQESAFNGCVNLQSLTLPITLEGLGKKAFHGCTSLKTLEIPSGVEKLPYDLLSGCSGLEEIILHDGLTSIGIGAFSYCKSLKEIQIPETVTDLGSYVFCHCKLLEKINIPEGVTILKKSTFSRCTSLVALNLPSTLLEIEEEVFQNCSSLVSLSLFDQVKKIDVSVFLACDSLESITIFQRRKGGAKSLEKRLQKLLPHCSVDIISVC